MEAAFRRLLGNIRLTDNQKQDAVTKYTTVCKALHDYYYPGIDYNGTTKALIGSYGKDTNIRPPRDIDIVFKMPEKELERFDKLAGNKQSQLLQEVRKILSSRFPLTEEIRAFGKVVVVPFAEGTHTVEVLPAWELADGSFKIPNTERGGFWDNSNPFAEMKSITESQIRTGVTKDFIRICKKWVEYCNVELESFIVEIIVVNFLEIVNNPKEEGFFLLLINFLNYLVNQKDTLLLRPTGAYYQLGNNWVSKTNSAIQRISRALDHAAKGKILEAETELKKLFGEDFTYSDFNVKLNQSEKIAILRTRFPSGREEYLDSTYGIPFRINKAYKIQIDAQIEQDGYRTRSLKDYIREKLKLKKHKSILFKVTENNVPQYDEIRWKVRNFGEEAQALNQLRGQIYSDDGNNERKETTRYFGEHFVECYVIKDRCCVAVDRIFVPIGTEQ